MTKAAGNSRLPDTPLDVSRPTSPVFRVQRDQHIRDKERITTDASALESLILTVAATLKRQAEQTTPPLPPTFEPRDSPSVDASGNVTNSLQKGSIRTEGVQGLPPPTTVVTISPLVAGEEGSRPAAARPNAGGGL